MTAVERGSDLELDVSEEALEGALERSRRSKSEGSRAVRRQIRAAHHDAESVDVHRDALLPAADPAPNAAQSRLEPGYRRQSRPHDGLVDLDGRQEYVGSRSALAAARGSRR